MKRARPAKRGRADGAFDHLSESEFEEFTYDLLTALGFTNLSWHRGSGKGGATADRGRDVVAERLERDVDGHSRLEKWLVQCKHYVAGVPPEKLLGATSWAAAERPAVLLFVVSNFLSNPAKAWLDDLEKSNRPPFRIKIWERKDLEALVSTRPKLAVKYRVRVDLPLDSVHPAHLLYMLRPSTNSLEYLFAVLDRLESEDRDALLSFSRMSVINPRFRDPVTGDETMADLKLDDIDYPAFKRKCLVLVDGPARLADDFLVKAIVNDTLTWACEFADPVEHEATVRRNRDAMAYFMRELDKESKSRRRERLRQMIESCRERIDSAPQNLATAVRRYRLFCEKVLLGLYLEEKEIRRRLLPDPDDE